MDTILLKCPVSTQHRFNFDFDTTLFMRQQRCYNVETTSCLLGDHVSLKMVTIWTFNFDPILHENRLERLNLSCNKISSVPHLRLMAAHRHFSMSTCADINSQTAMRSNRTSEISPPQKPNEDENSTTDNYENKADEEKTIIEVHIF